MKYVLVLLVVSVVAWVMLGRGRGRGGRPGAADPADATKTKPGTPAHGSKKTAASTPAMVACIHCGLHLPRAEAVSDAQGRLFCDEAHRIAGPR